MLRAGDAMGCMPGGTRDTWGGIDSWGRVPVRCVRLVRFIVGQPRAGWGGVQVVGWLVGWLVGWAWLLACVVMAASELTGARVCVAGLHKSVRGAPTGRCIVRGCVCV